MQRWCQPGGQAFVLPSHVMLYPQPLCTDLPWNVFHFLFLAISPTEHMDVCASVCLHAGVGSSRKRWFVLHLNTRELCYYAKAFCPPHQPGPKGQRPSCHASTLYICPIPTHLLYIYMPHPHASIHGTTLPFCWATMRMGAVMQFKCGILMHSNKHIHFKT